MISGRFAGFLLALMVGPFTESEAQRLTSDLPTLPRPLHQADIPAALLTHTPSPAKPAQGTTIPLGMLAGATLGFGIAAIADYAGDGSLETYAALPLLGMVVGLIVGYYVGQQ